MMQNTFTVGDVVRLKSGGPRMTVEHVVAGSVAICIWFIEGRKFSTYFVCDTLMPSAVEDTPITRGKENVQ